MWFLIVLKPDPDLKSIPLDMEKTWKMIEKKLYRDTQDILF
jgi:hypothetical protein